MSFVAGSTIVPVPGATLMSRQGLRPGRSAWHNGIDLSGEVGTAVYAAAAGTVEKVVNTCLSKAQRAALSARELRALGGPCNCGATYGNYVVVKHADSYYTLYAHLDTVLVTVGQTVSTATQVGTVGSTTALPNDRCTSMVPHLHFEIVKSWPLGSSDTSSRYDVLHELAAGGIAISGGGLAVTGIASSYNEPALAQSKAFAKTSLSYDPVPPGTPNQAKVSKWPLYVALVGVLTASALILWKLRYRLSGRGPGR